MSKKKILKQFIKAGYVFSKELFPTEKGTPQGGVISPTLANMVLNGMEKAVSDVCVTAKTIRYADDFVVVCKTREDIDKCRSVIDGFMMERGLKLSPEKTMVTNITEGFDFLGWNFRKYKVGNRFKLIIRPSKGLLSHFLKR